MVQQQRSVSETVELLNKHKLSLTAARQHHKIEFKPQKGFLPSGKRLPGQGCEDEEQGILAAQAVEGGGAKLQVTLLAAGFVIGPSGASVREISRTTGADIRSWNDKVKLNGRTHQVRSIVVEGKRRAVVLALEIITAAVERYKELCEGKYCGHVVDRLQFINGTQFFYQPPPRAAVPYAAALKSHADEGPAGPVKVLDVQPLQQQGRELHQENDLLLLGKQPAAAVVPQQAQQLALVAPNLMLPVEAVLQAPGALSATAAHLLSTTPLGTAYSPLGLPAAASDLQAGQLLDALWAGMGHQLQPVMPDALPLPSQPPGMPLAALPSSPVDLERTRAGTLEDMMPGGSMDIERVLYSAMQPSYSLFSTAPLCGTDLMQNQAAAPEHMLTPVASVRRQMAPDSTLLAGGLPGAPSFQSFAQQSPYYTPTTAGMFPVADPWLLDSGARQVQAFNGLGPLPLASPPQSGGLTAFQGFPPQL